MAEHHAAVQEVAQTQDGQGPVSGRTRCEALPNLLSQREKEGFKPGARNEAGANRVDKLDRVTGEADEELQDLGRISQETPADTRKVTVQAPQRFIAAHSTEIPGRVRAAFEAFDSDRSGALDKKELRNALRLYGIDVSAAAATNVLAAYDDHPDGSLEIAEFAHLVRDAEAGGVYATEPVNLPEQAIAEPATGCLEIVFDDNGTERTVKIFKKPLGAQFSKWWFGYTKISKVSKRSYAEGLGLRPGWQVKTVAGEDMSSKSLKETQAAIMKGMEPLVLLDCHGMTKRHLESGITRRALRTLTHRSFGTRKA